MNDLKLFLILSILLRISCPGAADKDSGLFSDYENDRDGDYSSGGSQKTGGNWSTVPIGFLPLPPGYNKLAIPLGNISESILVKVYLSIREVLDVDIKNGIIELDTEIGLTWFDWQIWEYFIKDKYAQEKRKTWPEALILNSEFLRRIWRPDIYIDEMAGVERTSILSKLITLKFIVNNPSIPGAISYKARQTLKLRCDMDFHYYPADTQMCQYTIRSYSYTQDQLFLIWDPYDNVYLNEVEDSNYDFQISNVEPFDTLDDLYVTSQVFDIDQVGRTRNLDPELSLNFSALSFTLQIRRNLNYHLVQTYLPSMLLIFVTWLCFLLPADMVEVRIGISMTTLLTLTAMFAAVREQSPEVSYSMAIDTWMVFCIFSVFIALVLFTLIYWMRRKVGKSGQGDEDYDEQTITPHADKNMANGVSMVVRSPAQERKYKKLLTRSKYAFWIFVFIFLIFLSMYACWLTFASEYYSWNPSKLFNAVDESNQLFVRQEHEFEESNIKRAVAAAKRETKMVQEKILPILYQVKQQKLKDATSTTVLTTSTTLSSTARSVPSSTTTKTELPRNMTTATSA